jgi:hypothetical protein
MRYVVNGKNRTRTAVVMLGVLTLLSLESAQRGQAQIRASDSSARPTPSRLTHRGNQGKPAMLGQDTSAGRPTAILSGAGSEIRFLPRLGGLHHRYAVAAQTQELLQETKFLPSSLSESRRRLCPPHSWEQLPFRFSLVSNRSPLHQGEKSRPI